MSRRTLRIGEQVRAEIARILREEVTDPRVGLVTVLRVDVAPDLSNALVFWSALEAGETSEPEGVQAGLDSAASFVRRRLAQILPLRRVPALSFRHDPSIEMGNRTLGLLSSLRDETDES